MINRISEAESRKSSDGSPLSMLHDVQDQVMERLKDVDVKKVMKEYPVAVLAAGAAVGLLLGWWVKRR